MNKMPAEVAQTPTEQADLTQPPGLGESPNTGQNGPVKSRTPDDNPSISRTPDGNPSARLNLDLPLVSQRYSGTSNGEIKREDLKSSPDDSTVVKGADRGTAHFYRRHNERHPGNGFCESLAFDMQRHWPHGTGGCDIHGSSARGLVASQRRAEYRDRHGRRYQSERPLQQEPDGPLPNEWSRANGGSHHQNGTSCVDDMENYFNANAHLLAYLELNEDAPEQNGPDHDRFRGNPSQNGEVGLGEPLPRYHQQEGGNGMVNGELGSRRSQIMLSGSSDDQGDFIEPDMCLGPQELEHGGNSLRWSSEEELPQLTPSLISSINSHGQQKLSLKYNSDSVRKPGDGPRLVAPANNATHNHDSSVCDYKKHEDQDVPRPVSFGAANRLCTCSVVSYSLGRPDLTSSQSMSSGEVDEGVGGMKVSPAEPSPSESEGGGAQCGVTVTSDSSSYFSPEDVDFMDFDMEPTMATPLDSVGEFGEATNIPYHGHAISGAHDYSESTETTNKAGNNSGMISCEDCSKPNKDCLCQRLHVCKRLLEVAKNSQRSASASASPGCSHEPYCYDHQGLNDLQERKESGGRCGCFSSEIGGNDSGAGSQEHLDELSSDDQGDDTDMQPICPPRSCNCPVSRYYLGAPVCDQHDLYCHDTNNLDVEVFNAPSSDYEDELFNVSRQTSTSNFDQDENAYQDAVEDLASNGFHSACSGSDLESEKNNHSSNNHGNSDQRAEGRATFPGMMAHNTPEIPLPIPARGEESPRRRPPSIPPAALNPSLDMDGGGASSGVESNSGPRPSWSTQSSDDISPIGALNWSDYDAPSDDTDAKRRWVARQC